jgi:hypothetical protein
MPAMDVPAALGGDAVAAAGRVLLAYAAVLAMPGPNALAIGAVAAAHGLAGAVPLCLGVACGGGGRPGSGAPGRVAPRHAR